MQWVRHALYCGAVRAKRPPRRLRIEGSDPWELRTDPCRSKSAAFFLSDSATTG
jgi:hypothetical protein